MFYHLKVVEDPEQVNPSISEFRPGYDFDSDVSATHIHRYTKIDFVPDLDFLLDSNGKATDAIKVSAIMSSNLFVSESLFHALVNFKLADHQFFKGCLRASNNILPYYLIHFLFSSTDSNLEYIDFNKTTFYAENTMYPVSIMSLAQSDGLIGEFNVSNCEEWWAIRRDHDNDSSSKIIAPFEKLYLKNNYLLQYDIFCLDFNNWDESGFIVSEQLAEKINNDGYTGLKLTKLNYEILYE